MKKAVNMPIQEAVKGTYLDYVKDAGLDGCDIGLDRDNVMIEKDWEDIVHKAKEELDKRGLVCTQVHLPYHNIFRSSEIIEDDIKQCTLNSMKAMSILGCKWGAYHPRTAFNNNCSSEVAIKDNYKEISIYLEEALKYNVGIAVENIPIFPDCPMHKFFSADYDELNYLVDSFKSENVKVCWDFGHANLMPIKQEKAFKILGDKIRITHIHNNYGYCDSHVVPTLGTIDWANVMPALKNSGYDGAFALELNFFKMTSELKSYFAHGYDGLCMLEKHFNN